MTSTSSNTSSQLESSQNLSIGAFVTSLGTGLATFGALLLLFYVLKLYLPRIYRPRTYLVPEKDRTSPPPPGLWRWIIPIFSTRNSEFIHKCGLDAFFFLRYLRMLLKLFIPMACLILPILLPINATGGVAQMASMSHNQTDPTAQQSNNGTISGLNVLSWGNVAPKNHNRYWAHLVLAVLVVIYVCYTVFVELRSYIRVRQTYLTSPQHRLRASATTVLVKTIPDKWNTVEALDGLFDVFPGGVRNIWINRDFQDLSDKIDQRDTLAQKLESAETNLIKNAKDKNDSALKKKAKAERKKGGDKTSKDSAVDGVAESKMSGDGISAGNPHQVRSLREFFRNDAATTAAALDDEAESKAEKKRSGFGLSAVGEGLGHGFDTVNQGLRGVTRFGNQGLGAMTQGVAKVARFGVGHKDEEKETPADGVAQKEKDQQDRDLLQSGVDDLDLVSQTHWTFWKKSKPMPSPHPHAKEEDEFPLTKKPSTPGSTATQSSPIEQVDVAGDSAGSNTGDEAATSARTTSEGKSKKSKATATAEQKYPPAYDESVIQAASEEEDAEWRKHLKASDRETMRLPLFGWSFMPYMPSWTFIGKKVDVIYYCRKELARLNVEIEADQKEPEKYPLMNSAFIQFNHQVAAHMACQSLTHHVPLQMAPRMIEISPDDVIWDNMAIKWWESYLRNAAIILVIAAMVVFWAIPSAFVGGLSHLNKLTQIPGLEWINNISKSGQSFLQGVIPAVITSIMFILVPIILQFFHRLAGCSTGNQVQQSTQMSYFAFLFVNLFLVVTIAASITTVVNTLRSQLSNPTQIPGFLASNLPAASNYFFSYMILQALSTSAGALAQIGTLVVWVILRPLLDSTARQRWKRQTSLPSLNWGTFVPPYTNFACIGLIYSIIAPLIMVFNIITFGLFWIAYRYNTLYVNKFTFDTGGLLFPTAINQLFTGLYVMEACLIGLFFLVREADVDGTSDALCTAQGIIMIVVLVLTIVFQVLVNVAFGPLLRFLPITLEDDAVMRDEAFARAQDSRWGRDQEGGGAEDGSPSHSGSGSDGKDEGDEMEMQHMSEPQSISGRDELSPGAWSERRRSKSGEFGRETVDLTQGAPESDKSRRRRRHNGRQAGKKLDALLHPPESSKGRLDLEAQADKDHDNYLFGNYSDTIEDLTPEERDALIDRAFRHRALRARRPCIWIPRDELGVSDDEVRRTDKLTDYVWISNEHAVLDSNGTVVFKRSPPDFSDIDLVEL